LSLGCSKAEHIGIEDIVEQSHSPHAGQKAKRLNRDQGKGISIQGTRSLLPVAYILQLGQPNLVLYYFTILSYYESVKEKIH
jgi:hypothetical protein